MGRPPGWNIGGCRRARPRERAQQVRFDTPKKLCDVGAILLVNTVRESVWRFRRNGGWVRRDGSLQSESALRRHWSAPLWKLFAVKLNLGAF